PYLSNSNVYLLFEIFNRYFPNTQFNKPDPFIFGLSPLVLNPSRQTVTVNGRGLLDATLTSYQYMVNIKEIPLSLRAEDDPNTIKTRSYVGVGEVNETRTISSQIDIPPL
ncbi:hypothetical protein ID849_19785, partial [Xenorhabdus sp. 3]|uniref:hypothetical protein n=1 Tax=Xenorhabdus doucetiae TaxID=351671 RepID=UPI00199E2900